MSRFVHRHQACLFAGQGLVGDRDETAGEGGLPEVPPRERHSRYLEAWEPHVPFGKPTHVVCPVGMGDPRKYQ